MLTTYPYHSTIQSRRRVPTALQTAAAALSLLTLTPSLLAEEAPSYSVSIRSNLTIYTATPASSSVPGFLPHVNFPYLKTRADGTLEMDFTVGQTRGVGIFGVRAYSSDGGNSWSNFTTSAPSRPNSSLVLPSGSTSYGVSYAMNNPAGQSSFTNTLYTSTNGGTSWSFSNANFSTPGVSYTSISNNYTDMLQSNGTLFTTAYGQRLGSSTQEAILFASTDNGSNWTRRSTIASYFNDSSIGMGTEGPSESTIARLANGNILSVFRTSQPFPSSSLTSSTPGLMWAMSSDNGSTWTTAKRLGVSGVFPLLHAMDDGSFALTYGRYGARIMFVDPTGTRWSTPTVLYNGPGSGHTDLKKSSAGGWAFAYDQSSFYPPSYNASPPNAYVYNNNLSGNAKVALLNITRNPTTDDRPWKLEFHGDVTPDKAPYNWAKTASGSTSTREWADLGQDYIRLSTVNPSDRLYYTLTSPTWADQNFDKGIVVDIRARCDLATAQGGADLLISDATRGSVIFRLTQFGASLEGLGGPAAQVSYLTSAHPGYNVYDFHTYRIITVTDLTSPSTYAARLFLDADLINPILSIPVSRSAFGMLRVGNVGSTSSSSFDIDFIRFAPVLDSQIVPEPNLLLPLLVTPTLLLRRPRTPNRR